jgi:Zn-dependent M28 family amino/carboxypeptidase
MTSTVTRKLLLIAASALILTAAITHTSAQAKPTATTGGHFNGQAAYDYAKQYLDAAPRRWLTSPGHAAAEQFITDHFKPEAARGNLEVDSFTATTSLGMMPVKNFIVKFPGKKDGVIVIATHYETNYWLRDTSFMGANDGAATTGLLIELGNYFRAHPPQGYSVWLLFDDAEESMKSQWSDTDALFGTRHLAAKWSANGTIGKIKAFLLADMIGDKDLNINRDDNSTPWLLDLLSDAAKNTGHSAYVFKHTTAVTDDHIPFRQRGVPVLDIIDIDYGPHTARSPEGYHHTEQDTLDKISPRSLQISGDLFLEMVRLINERH